GRKTALPSVSPPLCLLLTCCGARLYSVLRRQGDDAMRALRNGLGLLLLGLCGCWTTEPTVKPPTPGPEWVLPPRDDPKFSSPPTYPKINNDPNAQPKKELGPPGPGGMRGPAGMGAGGGMSPY